MKHHYKYLLKNIGLLTLSSFATKLLSFFLVPLYTNILTTTEYGTYDLFNTMMHEIQGDTVKYLFRTKFGVQFVSEGE